MPSWATVLACCYQKCDQIFDRGYFQILKMDEWISGNANNFFCVSRLKKANVGYENGSGKYIYKKYIY